MSGKSRANLTRSRRPLRTSPILTITVGERDNTFNMTATINRPSGAPDAPIPAIIGINTATGSLPADLFSLTRNSRVPRPSRCRPPRQMAILESMASRDRLGDEAEVVALIDELASDDYVLHTGGSTLSDPTRSRAVKA